MRWLRPIWPSGSPKQDHYRHPNAVVERRATHAYMDPSLRRATDCKAAIQLAITHLDRHVGVCCRRPSPCVTAQYYGVLLLLRHAFSSNRIGGRVLIRQPRRRSSRLEAERRARFLEGLCRVRFSIHHPEQQRWPCCCRGWRRRCHACTQDASGLRTGERCVGRSAKSCACLVSFWTCIPRIPSSLRAACSVLAGCAWGLGRGRTTVCGQRFCWFR